MNSTAAPYTFHAAEMSYFSAKVRPALRYKALWYREVLPDYVEIQKRTGLAFIPILVTPEDDTWQDTSEILDALEARHPDPPLYPTTPLQRVAAHLIELYADEVALLPAMHYRWSFPEGEAKARAEFVGVVGNRAAASHFADRMKGFLPPLGVHPRSIPVIEAHTRELLDALSAHFEQHPYLLGSRLSLADCALMGPFYAHLYWDAVPGRLLRETAPGVCAWIERCNRPRAEQQGTWLANDALAPTLLRVLEAMGRDGAPLLLDAALRVEEWTRGRAPGEEPPRFLGQHETQLRGVAITRATSSYTVWMVQRALDVFHSLGEADRTGVAAALAGSGWGPLLAAKLPRRIGKRRFQLVLE